MKTILLIQRHGSIAGAARAISVDPSSVSRTLAAVEAGLGLRLFQRSTRRLATTEEGAAYLQRIAPLIEELDAARDAARKQRHAPSGTLKLTASVAFSAQVLLPLMPDFRSRFPDITVNLHSTDATLDLVEANVDLAIRLAPAPRGDLISTRLMPTCYRAVASPAFIKQAGRPDTPVDLAETECLRFALPGLQNRWRFRRANGKETDVEVTGGLLATNALNLRQAALQGMGVALLADWLIAEDIAEGTLIDLFPEHQATLTDFDTAAWALYPDRSYLPRKVRVMLDFLKERLSKRRS